MLFLRVWTCLDINDDMRTKMHGPGLACWVQGLEWHTVYILQPFSLPLSFVVDQGTGREFGLLAFHCLWENSTDFPWHFFVLLPENEKWDRVLVTSTVSDPSAWTLIILRGVYHDFRQSSDVQVHSKFVGFWFCTGLKWIARWYCAGDTHSVNSCTVFERGGAFPVLGEASRGEASVIPPSRPALGADPGTKRGLRRSLGRSSWLEDWVWCPLVELGI